jgi:hypothetical protein
MGGDLEAAELRYRLPTATLTEYGEDNAEEQFGPYSKIVRDGRQRRGELSLFKNGFVLTDHPLEGVVDSFYDAEHMRAAYYPSIKGLVQSLLPDAMAVIPTNHIARNEGDAAYLAPHHLVHNDFTEKFIERICSIVPKEQEHRFRQNRVVMLNLWRPTAATAQIPLRRNPLALCDRRSIARTDLVPTVLSNYGTAENPTKVNGLTTFTSKFSDEHEWYYFSDLTRDEVMVFVTFDSHPEGGVFIPTLHSAIDLPGQDHEPPRESCEIRVLCLLPLPGTDSKIPAANL